MSMVAYWAVDRQGLQEATAAAGGDNGGDALQTGAEQDGETNTASGGRAANGDGCSGAGEGGANGRRGVSGEEEEEGREGGVSQQERVFLDIVARY